MDEKEDYKKLSISVKNNIIDWYPFEADSKILEISSTNYFFDDIKCEKLVKITHIEELDKEQNFKFSYIILIGNLKNLINDISKIKSNLESNGKIIIITNNICSVKTICMKNSNVDENISLDFLEDILKANSMFYRKYYYPLTNYKTTNVIFTDKHLPDAETITRNITFYSEDQSIEISENKMFKKILKQDSGMFKRLTNSYFIECSENEFEDNKIEFVSFSDMRKEKYRIKTIIKGDKVYKTYACSEAIEHVKQIKNNIDILNNLNLKILDSYKDDTIISKYQIGIDSLDKQIVNLYYDKDKNVADELIKRFYNELKGKLLKIESEENIFKLYNIEYKDEDIENLTFVKYGFWDLIFQNTFLLEDEFYFYDQEWMENNIPVEFILYRAIKYCQELNKIINIPDIYSMIGIQEKNIDLFNKLDDKLQEKTRSELSWKIHTQVETPKDIIKENKQKIEQLEEDKNKILSDTLELLNQKDSRIKFLEDNMNETCKLLKDKEHLIAMMQNSTSWKITKPLRRLRSGKKGEKNENKR